MEETQQDPVPDARSCPSCGASAEDDGAFCIRCGSRIDEVPGSTVIPLAAGLPRDALPVRLGKVRKAVAISAVVVLVAGLAVVLFGFFTQRSAHHRDALALRDAKTAIASLLG